jgi:Spy/CpxP family protein refolding chaperone
VSTTRRMAAAGLAAGCLLWPGVAPAAPQGPPPDREERREDVQETIEIYMVAKLKRFLQLTEAQERQVIPLIEELNSTRREANRKRRQAILRLRPMVEEGAEEPADEAAIQRQVDELERLERDVRDTEGRVRQQIRAQLTPLQQARFIVFQERFRQEIQDRLRRMEQDEPGGPFPGGRRPPPGGPGGPR